MRPANASRLIRIALAASLIGACGTDPVIDTDFSVKPTYGRVRVLLLVGDETALDTIVTRENELPLAVGAVPSPGLSAFRPHASGAARAFLSKAGRTLASAEHEVAEGLHYTIVHAGFVGEKTPAVATSWIDERFVPVAGKARVRFIAGSTVKTASSVKAGATVLASDLALGAAGAFIELEPGAAAITVSDASGTLATFSGITLAAGDVRTLVLVDGPAYSPLQLLDVQEQENGEFTSSRVNQDGTSKPKAWVRLLHAAGAVGAVDVSAGPAIAAALAKDHVSAYVEVEADALLQVTENAQEIATSQLALTVGGRHTAALVGRAGAAAPQQLRLVLWTDEPGAQTGPLARLAVAVAGLPGAVALVDTAQAPVLPATAFPAVSAYQAVPAGPFEGAFVLAFGANQSPVATVSGLSFPSDKPVTAALIGAFAPPAQPGGAPTIALSLVLIDDAASVVLETKTVEPIAAQP